MLRRHSPGSKEALMPTRKGELTKWLVLDEEIQQLGSRKELIAGRLRIESRRATSTHREEHKHQENLSKYWYQCYQI